MQMLAALSAPLVECPAEQKKGPINRRPIMPQQPDIWQELAPLLIGLAFLLTILVWLFRVLRRTRLINRESALMPTQRPST